MEIIHFVDEGDEISDNSVIGEISWNNDSSPGRGLYEMRKILKVKTVNGILMYIIVNPMFDDYVESIVSIFPKSVGWVIGDKRIRKTPIMEAMNVSIIGENTTSNITKKIEEYAKISNGVSLGLIIVDKSDEIPTFSVFKKILEKVGTVCIGSSFLINIEGMCASEVYEISKVFNSIHMIKFQDCKYPYVLFSRWRGVVPGEMRYLVSEKFRMVLDQIFGVQK